MKDQKQSFDKMVEWAREAHTSPEFELSSELRERVLKSWRRETASEGGVHLVFSALGCCLLDCHHGH
jgi:hypothetical protein